MKKDLRIAAVSRRACSHSAIRACLVRTSPFVMASSLTSAKVTDCCTRQRPRDWVASSTPSQ